MLDLPTYSGINLLPIVSKQADCRYIARSRDQVLLDRSHQTLIRVLILVDKQVRVPGNNYSSKLLIPEKPSENLDHVIMPKTYMRFRDGVEPEGIADYLLRDAQGLLLLPLL